MEWIEQVIARPVKQWIQDDGRLVLWGNIADAEGRALADAEGRALRVVMLEDRETVHNAFFDRNFLKRQKRGEEPT